MYLSLTFILQTVAFYTFISQSLSSQSLSFKDTSKQPSPPELEEGSMTPPKPGWIDPFDMLGESRPRDSLIVQSDVEIHMLQKRCTNYDIYLRRFVNMFLNAVELMDRPVLENSMNFIKLEFLIPGGDIDTLKKFGQGGSNTPKIEVVSDVFTKIFSQKTAQGRNVFSISNVLIWFQKTTLKIISSPEWTVLSSVILMLFSTLWLIFKSHNYRLALFTFIFTVFCAGFGFTWIRIYEEKEVEKYVKVLIHGAVPRHCSSESQSMAWYEHMYYRMFGVDCYEFYKIRDVRAIVKVSPTDVLAETFSSMFISPAANLGSAYGNFIRSVLSEVPWWLKGIALPLSFILPIFFFVILLAFLFNYRLSLSITGLHLIPSWGQTNVTKENKYVEECPHKASGNLEQSSAFNSLFSNTRTPVFMMNWMGIKKLSSSNLLREKDEKELPRESLKEEDNNSLEDNNEQMMEEFNNFEEFLKSIENQKAIEECKKGDLHACTEGESSLTNRRSDLQSKPMTECTELFGDKNNTSTPPDKEKDYKHKTT